MIIVRVELHSAITGKVTELARMDICNVGGTTRSGNYEVSVMRGRDKETLSKRTVQRKGTVEGYPRLKLHVWNLVLCALITTGYRGAHDEGPST